MTLSHCWGNPPSVFKLKTTNLASLLKQIPPLSKTFEDAIVCTRAVGARYLWIDCLCILQDDVRDWERESALMASVYHNALCNLAATASSDSNGGFFRDRSEIRSGINVLVLGPNSFLIKE